MVSKDNKVTNEEVDKGESKVEIMNIDYHKVDEVSLMEEWTLERTEVILEMRDVEMKSELVEEERDTIEAVTRSLVQNITELEEK